MRSRDTSTTTYGISRTVIVPVLTLALGAVATLAAQAPADLPQAPTPNLATLNRTLNVGTGGLPVLTATPGPLRLSLDDAIQQGMEYNLQQVLAQQNERAIHGEIYTVGNALLPNLTAQSNLPRRS